MISEEEARAWLRATLSVSRETEARLAAFVDLWWPRTTGRIW